MARSFRSRAAVLQLLAVFLSRFAAADESDDRRKQLAEMDRRIAQAREAIQQQGEQEKSELAQLDEAQKIVGMLAEEARILDAAVVEQSAKVADAERQMASVQADFEQKKAALRERLVALYKMGEMSYARLLLSVQDATDMASAYAYVSKLIEGDRAKVKAYQDALGALTRQRDDYGRKAAELSDLKRVNDARQTELVTERQKRIQALALIRKERSRELQLLADLETAAGQLRKLLNEMPATIGSLDMAAYRGALKWPNPGKVTFGFGLHRHPQFNTVTVQNGIDIDAPFDDPVTAVFRGKVVFADWFRGYGNLIILDHGDRFFSLYAHLSRFAVGLGEAVDEGVILGYVGDTGSLKGAYLYFELRQGERPLNPTDWLQRRRNAG